MFGFLGKVVKVAVETAIVPVAVAKDVVTLGGIVTDEDAATPEQLGNVAESIEELFDGD